ncbi:hypothetical protein ACQ4PT_042235 [Festuca glaucescens]
MAPVTRSHLSVLRGFVALAAAVLYFSGAAAEARLLLTLDDFGAVGDGVANDTQAFLDAWTAACGSQEQAVLAVPAAKAYRIWPLQLTGPCKKKLKLLIAGTIVAPASPDEWAGRGWMKWLYIYGVDNLSVSGGGTIDGAGQEWWARSCKRKKTQPCNTVSPPRAVHFEECRGVSVQGVTLQNGQHFHLSFTRCTDVKANFLRVVAPADSPNTDGIHLNDTSRVEIMDNLISVGDDCVSMVGNCSDIRVSDISCGPGHGISIGSLGKNRTTDRVENVRVETCLLTNTTNGVRIKSWFENIVMKNVSSPIIIDQYYCDQPTPCANQTEAVEVRKVEFVDVRGTSATAQAINIACSDTVPCRELELKNVNLTLEGGGVPSASCYKAFGKAVATVVPASCLAKQDS